MLRRTHEMRHMRRRAEKQPPKRERVIFLAGFAQLLRRSNQATREVTLVRKGLYGVRNLARTRALGGYMNELSRPLLFV